MSLQFVAGPSGCGKSHYVYKKTADESVKDPDGRFFVIVPEQFSVEAESLLTRLHPKHVLLNTNVMSFNRLAYRVFEETGVSSAPILEDTGKILVLQKVINDSRDELKIMKGILGKNGAASRMNATISELTQYRVDPEEIDTSADGISGLLKAKIEDISLIRKRFFEYIESRYLTAEEVPEVLSRVIDKYEPLKGATVVFDGFTGFVPTQLAVIKKMLTICKSVTVTVTVDKGAGLTSNSSQSNLFHLSHMLTESLISAAREVGAPVLPDIWIEPKENGRINSSEALTFLENHIFRYDYKKFDKEQDAIFIGEAKSARDEAEFAAETIARLVRTENYRYRDFAFVSGDIERYGSLAQNIFQANNIPCFLDKKQSIAGNPAVEFVRAAADMAAEDFSYKSVFRWLKTGMTSLTGDEVDLLENYVLAAGIRGLSKYKKPWERTFKTIEAEELEAVNKIREKFVECASSFADEFKKRNGSVKLRTTALYRLVADNDIQGKCKEKEEFFKAVGDTERAGEYAQIYKAIMHLFDKLVEVMADEKVSLDLYKRLLDAAFDDMTLGIPPMKQDQVLIGDIDRSRLSNIKVMIFAGLNDGIVPKAGGGEGVLSEGERSALSKTGVDLAPDARDQMYRQRLYLYMNLTKPSDRLYLSYSRKDETGGASSPSYLIETICNLLPQIKVSDIDNRSGLERAEIPAGCEELLTRGYENIAEEKPGDEFKELVSHYLKGDENRGKIEAFNRAAGECCPKTKIKKEFAIKLYGINVPYSASRIETFGMCRFRHFLNYALKLRERDEFDFTAADIGSILHDAAKLFCLEMKNASWETLSDEARNIVADKAFITAYESNFASQGSSREFDILRLGSVNRKTAWIIAEQMKHGRFVPEAFEKPFMAEGIRGTIDRVDVCHTDGVDYIRIIDYKSGIKDFNMTDFYLGTQIQLPLYMTAACEEARIKNKKKVVTPAGIYYYTMADPLVEVRSLSEDVDEKKLLSMLKLKGVSIDDLDVLKLMDDSLAPGTASDIIPVKVKASKNGEISFDTRSSRIISGDDFYNIERYTRHKIKSIRKLIEGGNADIDPKETPQSDSCAYCGYRSVCRFDERISGYAKKKYSSEKDDDVLKRIADELAGERDDGISGEENSDGD